MVTSTDLRNHSEMFHKCLKLPLCSCDCSLLQTRPSPMFLIPQWWIILNSDCWELGYTSYIIWLLEIRLWMLLERSSMIIHQTHWDNEMVPKQKAGLTSEWSDMLENLWYVALSLLLKYLCMSLYLSRPDDEFGVSWNKTDLIRVSGLKYCSFFLDFTPVFPGDIRQQDWQCDFC